MTPSTSPHRRGAVLIIVLWTVVILAIILSSFAFLERTHLRLASNFANTNLLHNIALAGIETAKIELQNDEEPIDDLTELWASNPDAFMEIPVGGGTFSLTRPAQTEDSTEGFDYGIEDEASKINLRTATREMLLAFEEIDETMVDALEDWQDTDSDSKMDGAENEYYLTLPRPYACKNAPLSTLHELLLVKGFDRLIFFGEDQNSNGILDANENDGETTYPPDNSDGNLDRGLFPYITIYSSEKNQTQNNTERLDLTQATEQTLQRVLPSLTADEARAIVAYGQNQKFTNLGDLLKVTAVQENNDPNNNSSNASNRGGRPSSGRDRGGSRGGGNSNNRNTGEAENTATTGRGSSRNRPTGNAGNAGNGAQGARIITTERLKEIIDYCRVNNEEITQGRVNINTAPAEVLAVLPGSSLDLGEAIVSYRETAPFQSIADLLDVPAITEDAFILLSNHITTRSFQFRVRSEARIPQLKTKRTIIAILDRSDDKIKTIYWNEY